MASLTSLRLLSLSLLACASAQALPMEILGHRGACGYLPEHTLESASYAYAIGTDYVEEDVILTKDDVLIVSHDIHIDTTTNVASRFPGRARSDGRYYAIDFTWEELRSLRVNERVEASTGKQVFPKRFPSADYPAAGFRLCTIEEHLCLVQGLNRSTGRKVGVCPEVKEPRWHLAQGKDPGLALIRMLEKYGYTRSDDPVIVQCFDPAELRRLRELTKTKLRFIQLLDDNGPDSPGIDFDALMTDDGLKQVASFAEYIGPHLGQIVSGLSPEGQPQFTTLTARAHAAGLKVIPYTFRADALPKGVKDMDTLLDIFMLGGHVDGVFTDQSDLAVAWRARH